MVFNKKISASLTELKNTKTLVMLGLLIAAYVVLSAFNIYILPTARVTFSFVPLALAGAMFGPMCGAFVGTIGDVLSYITSQSAAGAYNFGFTINAFVIGFVYGMFLYKSDFSLIRIIIAKLIIAIIVEMLLTPVWLSVLYGKAFVALIIERIFKTVIFIPIEIFVVGFIVKKLYKYLSKEL